MEFESNRGKIKRQLTFVAIVKIMSTSGKCEKGKQIIAILKYISAVAVAETWHTMA